MGVRACFFVEYEFDLVSDLVCLSDGGSLLEALFEEFFLNE